MHCATVSEMIPENYSDGLYNEDLAPVPRAARTWQWWNMAALWVGMAVCIPTYTMGSGLIAQGLNWKTALCIVLFGNLIVLVPMTLNAMPGTKYGIPFPVLLRSSFGVHGANVAALLRGLVACCWFGIQTYFGGLAIYILSATLFGFEAAGPEKYLPLLDISPGQLVSFGIFWAIQLVIIIRGMESIKWLENLAAPFLLLVGAGLLVWAVNVSGGWEPLLAAADSKEGGGLEGKVYWSTVAAGVTGIVGFWATLSLNIPDFSRYAVSQRAQFIGQCVALPTTMSLFAGTGILVASATQIAFGEAIWDPVALMGYFSNPVLVVFALFALTLATISTNLAANVVSPANDFSNLCPRRISFRTGAVVTSLLGVLIMPWKLVSGNAIFAFLVAYGALLGPIAGIMIADYFVLRRQHLEVAELYRTDGIYRYSGGFSLPAFGAFFLAVLVNLPGFLVSTGLVEAATIGGFWVSLYDYAWFIGFGLAFVGYLLLKRVFPTAVYLIDEPEVTNPLSPASQSS